MNLGEYRDTFLFKALCTSNGRVVSIKQVYTTLLKSQGSLRKKGVGRLQDKKIGRRGVKCYLLGMAWAINYDFTAAVAAYNGPIQSWAYQQVIMDQEEAHGALLLPAQLLVEIFIH